MNNLSKEFLAPGGVPSDGTPIPLDAINTAVHTVPAGSTVLDELFLYVSNTTAGDVLFTCDIGGEEISFEVPANTMRKPLEGQPLGPGVVVEARGASAPALVVFGYVNRITTP